MMRPLMTLTLALAGLMGCGGGSGAEPEAVIRTYLEGIAQGDLEQAKSAWMTREIIAAHFDCPVTANLMGDLMVMDEFVARSIGNRNKQRSELAAIKSRTPGSVDEGAKLGGCRTKSKTDTVELQAEYKVIREGQPDTHETSPVRLAKVAGRWYMGSF